MRPTILKNLLGPGSHYLKPVEATGSGPRHSQP
jgi:hypothetical protein